MVNAIVPGAVSDETVAGAELVGEVQATALTGLYGLTEQGLCLDYWNCLDGDLSAAVDVPDYGHLAGCASSVLALVTSAEAFSSAPTPPPPDSLGVTRRQIT